MVGGVIEAVTPRGNAWRIVVIDKREGGTDWASVTIERSPHYYPRPGDSLWWQGRYAYWTPADKSQQDVRLERIGYASGVK